eukprot:CAMPEP_0197023862 /NCGR_PEP_ID=MMETSP1384-20130603/4505_1 /TAXON_ID=29189 /ORGANISM="Ammonia sp." /LENGTH=238 /DNA_ID=CAMNT_0042452149 /DNA_START=146 /DNA_END=862 /DNA_ORIENTATION=+
MAFLFRPLLQNNADLIEKLSNSGIIKHKEIQDVMLMVDRGDFITFNSYQDNAQPIGHNATISAPHMHAYALEYLHDVLQPGHYVLDVGSGSGYLSACFAHLVGAKGKVVGIEHIYELTAISINNVNKHHAKLLQTKQLELITGDGRNGYMKHAPYHAIHVGAAATPQVAEILCKQLREGGKMVIPVELHQQTQIFRVYTKEKDGKVTFKDMMDVMYVPLTDQKEQRETNQFVKTLMTT